MSERKFEIQTVGVEYVCDVCGIGVMQQTGEMLLVSPPRWPHKCSACGHKDTFYEKYPTIRHEDARKP